MHGKTRRETQHVTPTIRFIGLHGLKEAACPLRDDGFQTLFILLFANRHARKPHLPQAPAVVQASLSLGAGIFARCGHISYDPGDARHPRSLVIVGYGFGRDQVFLPLGITKSTGKTGGRQIEMYDG